MKFFSKLLQRLGLSKSGRKTPPQPTVTASSAVPPLSPEPLHEPTQVVIAEAIAETTVTEATPASPFPATDALEPGPENGWVNGDEQEAPVPEIVVHAPTRSLKSLLKDIEKYASWDPPTGPDQLKMIVSECRACYPDQEDAIQKRIQRGEEVRNCLKPFFKIGSTYGASSKEAKQELDKLKQVRPDLLERAKHTLQTGDSARQRWQESNHRKKSGKPVSKVKPRPFQARKQQSPAVRPPQQALPAASVAELHPSDIRGLQPSPRWTLLIDESGSIFGDGVHNLTEKSSKLGRLVGLLLPESHDLQPLMSGWHAVDKQIDEIDRVVQAVLNAAAGVLGINVRQLPSAPMERWTFGVLRLIDLVLRLLPLAGPTTLTVQIENRAEFSRGMEWPVIAYDAILRLSQAYPDRAIRIECRIQVIGKRDSSFNGYVDALAFIWSAASDYSRACLKQTGLEGTCFLPGDAAAIGRAWEWLDRGVTLDGEDWAILLAQPEAEQAGSLAGAILERLGQASQEDIELWQRYLDHTLGHLESKAIDLKILGRQVEWLERWSPLTRRLPPRLRLLWLTAKLSRANHLGLTEQPWMDELKLLGDRLLEENAHLVCRAELNLAVNATNRYQFDVAAQLLERWHDLPRSVPGLRYWAQVQSSLGQHAAFRGDNDGAIRYFHIALEAFSRLSDSKQAGKESLQTLTYRAIVLMDNPATSSQDIEAAVEKVTGPIHDAIIDLSTQAEDRDKYRHHLLIRWLAFRGTPKRCSEYLAQRDHWQVGEGFPWPLIQLYRGLLLKDTDSAAARSLVIEGYELATTAVQGPTVQLIGACCRTIAQAWGADWPDAETLLSHLTTELPAAASRIQRLRAYLSDPSSDPKDILRDVLPFNFH